MTRFEDWFQRAFPEQAKSLIGSGHPALVIMEAAYRDGGTETQIQIMGDATKMAMSTGQVIGDKCDYYVTLIQLGTLVRNDPAASPALNQVEAKKP